MTKIEILNQYKKQKKNTYRECDVINAMEKYLESYKQDQALQLQQTGVSTCFLEDVTDDVFNMGYKQVSCCKIAPITDENYCPKCGKKILK